MENNYENYELTEIEEANVVDVDDYTEEEQSGTDKGKLLALIVGGATVVGAGIALACKKRKDKKAGKPKKKRKKLMWVEVEDEAIEEEVDSVDEIDEEVE